MFGFVNAGGDRITHGGKGQSFQDRVWAGGQRRGRPASRSGIGKMQATKAVRNRLLLFSSRIAGMDLGLLSRPMVICAWACRLVGTTGSASRGDQVPGLPLSCSWGILLRPLEHLERPFDNAVAGGLPRFQCFRTHEAIGKLLERGLLPPRFPARGARFLAPSSRKGHLWLT